MEAFWKNFKEQQIRLQQQEQNLHICDLTNMENLNHGEHPLPPPRKYVSVFYIDGEPILPPLMTSEKRRQMQKFKEKALQIEQRIRDCKQHAHYDDVNNEDIKSETSRTSHCNTSGNISQRSQEYYESKLKESEESMTLLKYIIKKQQEGISENPIKIVNTAGNSMKQYDMDENQEKLQKLEKSELLIYDNYTNEVIQVPAEKSKLSIDDERKENVHNLPMKKPSHLLLAGVDGKGLTIIPSICLNPPTPLTVNKNVAESLCKADSDESLIISENFHTFSNLAEELNSNESLNSIVTKSDEKSIQNVRQSIAKAKKIESSVSVENNSFTPNKNVTAKIQQFEAISSESNTPLTSPEKFYSAKRTCLGTSSTSGTMSRSVTSPSIKLYASNRSSSSKSQSLGQDSDNSPENSLVRSSSFTLEGPSKALIDHMRQQKAVKEKKVEEKSPLDIARATAKKSVSSPLRAHRDTVESKAKKVQKVDLKSSKLKHQQKPPQSKLVQAATASISPYNTTALIQHTNNFYKTKRSPYDTSKTSHTSFQTMHMTSNSQMRKSSSTSSNLSQSRFSKTRSPSSTIPTSIISTTNLNKPALIMGKQTSTQMDKIQKEKFLRLLAQQEEEQRRLQKTFEMQQKLLLEELNQEMVAVQLKSPTNSSCNSVSMNSPHCKKQDDQTPATRSENSSMPSVDTKQNKPQQSQQSSPTISNNSSHVSDIKSPSQSANTHNSSYAIQYIQSSPTNPLTNSHLSSMDNSNANTSLDISMLSTQTSPDTLYLTPTPTTQYNTVNNWVGNKTTSSTSSSRRRLFTTEINAVENDENPLNSSRFIVSSSYLTGQRLVDQIQKSNQNNENFVVANNVNSRLQQEENSLLQHAAATKINAYARGFLVRRLFQTEQIQRIVQTIRDTLIFVLNLHLETMDNPKESHTPANIKLKARLLQQLSSACRTLYLVFFQTTVKERMEIIARDRKRIKTKLLGMNRRRIAG